MDLASSGPRPGWIADEAGHGEGDLEEVEWWNRVMTTLWPHMSKAAESTVRKVVEPMLDHDKPRGVSSMTFDQFQMGDAAPRVDHVALVPPDEPDEIQVQIKMTWKGNPTVVFRVEGPSIYGGLSPVKIAMTDFSVSGTAKVTLAHLLREKPIVGGVQVTLTEDPQVSYRVSVKAAPGMPQLSVSSIPGLSAAINNAVTSAMRERLVFPRAAGVVVASRHTPGTVRAIEDALEIKPVGQLRVTVVGARGLKNADLLGTSDPYAVVALGSRKTPAATGDAPRTATANNDLNPTWNEEFVLDVCSTEIQCLWVRVFDDDGAYGTDDLMGSVVLPLGGLPRRVNVRGEYPLKKASEVAGGGFKMKRGEITMVIRYEPFDDAVAGNAADEDGAREKETIAADVSSSTNASSTCPAAEAFRAKICALLGAEGATDRAALHDHVSSDPGTLEHLSDARLRSLAASIPPRMDVGAGLPLWAAYPDFERLGFVNDVLLALWPYAADAARHECALLNDDVFPSMLPSWIRAEAYVDVGGVPPTMEAVRVFDSPNRDSVLGECAMKIAGDASVSGSVAVASRFFPNLRARVTMCEMQFVGTCRGRLQPLIPRAPIVAGASVGFVGAPLVDAAIRLDVPFFPSVDLLSLPGMGLMRRFVFQPELKRRATYPAAEHVPVLDFEHPAVKQLTSASRSTGQHVVALKLKRARNLDATDFGGTSDPYAIAVMAGEAPYAERRRETRTKRATLHPSWEEEFKFTMNDVEDAGEILIAVFDRDPKSTTRGDIDPEKVRQRIKPVKHLHLRSLEHAERFSMHVTNIPWHKKKRREARAAGESTALRRPKSKLGADGEPKTMRGKLERARANDIARRAVAEPPVPPRVLTEAQRRREEARAAKEEKKAKKAAKRAATSKNLRADTRKNLAAFNPNRVVSDVEQCVVNNSVAQQNDLLGMVFVDFKALLEPGKSKTLWLPLEGGPAEYARRVERERDETGDGSRSSSLLERSRSLDAHLPDDPRPELKSSKSLSARMLSLVGGGGGGGGGSLARAGGGKGPAEIEISISWSTYEQVKTFSANESASSAGGGDASSASAASSGARANGEAARGSLHVEVSHAEDLCKPRATMTGKMSSEKLMPMVVLHVANQSASTATARGLNPTWKEHFDFPGVGMMDEVKVAVVHPTSRRAALGLGRRKNQDRSMGAVLVPVHAVFKAGSVSGVYALEGVKHGEIHLNMQFRLEKNYNTERWQKAKRKVLAGIALRGNSTDGKPEE